MASWHERGGGAGAEIQLLTLTLDTAWRSVVSSTRQSHCPLGLNTGTHSTEGWVDPRAQFRDLEK
jgi:hypothetical protein